MIIGIKSKANKNEKNEDKLSNLGNLVINKKESITPSCPKAGLKPTPKISVEENSDKDKKIILNIQKIIRYI